MRAAASPLVLVVASCAGSRIPDLDQDLDCPPAAATAAEAIDALDLDGDGLLTDADLAPGESVVVLLLGGGAPLTVATTRATGTELLEQPWADAAGDAPPVRFGVWHHADECSQPFYVTLWFFGPNERSPVLEPGPGRPDTLAFDVYPLEVGNIGREVTLSGNVEVTRVDGGRTSGFSDGSASTTLESYLKGAPTGQQVEVVALAFRQLAAREP